MREKRDDDEMLQGALLARIRAIDGYVALFAHGHILRVLVCRWIGLPVSCGSHFLLHTASLSELGYYQGIGAAERWNVAVAWPMRSLEREPVSLGADRR